MKLKGRTALNLLAEFLLSFQTKIEIIRFMQLVISICHLEKL